MKAMILAAGRGQRMRPLTDKLPKPLLPVNGKPLIVYHLEKLAQCGVTDVIINHAWLGKTIEHALGDGHEWGVSIRYSPEPEGGLETAGGIINALPLLGEQPFWLINGDIWSSLCFSELPTELAADDVAHLMLVDNPQHHSHGDFCVSRGRLEFKRPNRATLTYAGMGLFDPHWFVGRTIEKLPLRPLFDDAIRQQKLAATKMIGEQWFDIGTPQRLAELDNKLRGLDDLG